MDQPRCSFYQIGKRLTIEVYMTQKAASVTQDAEDAITLKSDQGTFKYTLTNPARLLSFAQNDRKVEIQLETDSRFSVLLKGTKEYDKNAKYEKMEEIGLQDGISNDYMDRIRAVYYSSDDRTKEAMLKSYYESQGTVISTKWQTGHNDSE